MCICSYKIITAPETDGQRPVYWSVLSSTAALWMPSKDKGEEDEDNNDMIQPPSVTLPLDTDTVVKPTLIIDNEGRED